MLMAGITMAGLHMLSHRNACLSDLTMENIEALTQYENTGYKFPCVTKVMYTGAYSMPMYCTTCSYKYGYVSIGGSSTCP